MRPDGTGRVGGAGKTFTLERIRQVRWTLTNLLNLEADFLAIYRVHDMYELPASKFFALAVRTVQYEGLMRRKLIATRNARLQRQQKSPTALGQLRARIFESGGEIVTVKDKHESYLVQALAGAN